MSFRASFYFISVDVFARFLVAGVGVLDELGAVLEGDFVDLGGEGGVAAVVRPVGVEHFDLGNGRVSTFFLGEVGLGEDHVCE